MINSNYIYEIVDYCIDSNDLYVNYKVSDKSKNLVANCINYYNLSDINLDNESSPIIYKKKLLSLLKNNNGLEFSLPKVSTLSRLLKYVYDCVCESEYNMCYIDREEWEELKEEKCFSDEDITLLKKDIAKYNLQDYVVLNYEEYKLCGFGGLQTLFNDDRERNEKSEFER